MPEDNIKISWKISEESYLKNYDIERNDNGSWKVIGSIKNPSNTGVDESYNFNDKDYHSASIYRISAYDINGSKTLSEVFKPSCSLINENFPGIS